MVNTDHRSSLTGKKLWFGQDMRFASASFETLALLAPQDEVCGEYNPHPEEARSAVSKDAWESDACAGQPAMDSSRAGTVKAIMVGG
jgi:hypothetical protein